MDTNPVIVTPCEIYAKRLDERTQLLEACKQRGDRIANLRLLIFLAAAVIIWRAFHGLSIFWIAVPLVIFIALVSWQSRIDRAAECARRSIRFYERGIARLENRWQGTGEDGARFADPHHPYASDLDLFGHASLFELLSTARTRGGEERLASWLKSASGSPAATDELTARHQAIDELRPLLDLREQIAVLGDDYRTGVNPAELSKWAADPARPFSIWLRTAAFVLAVLMSAALIWWIADEFVHVPPRLYVLITGLIEGLLALSIRTRVLAIVRDVEEPARDLNLLSQLLATLEQQQFQSPLLLKLRGAIDVDGKPASRRIARLRRLIELLDSRDNPICRAIGPLLLWTTQTAMAVESWRAANGPLVPKWLEAVSEIEALTSLANYAWEHPADPFPEFCTAAESVFDGEDMAHPLLPDAVRNSVRLATPLRAIVVSGSNMSGKSTLLRTIGVNTILALTGAPVRAKRLALSHLSLGASIRTIDSLEEGHSRFLAEILRLKQILELSQPALFLLDELLGGTNSHDRALGSRGLIHALLDRGAIGLLTTHDLALSAIADELAPAAANFHFEDRLENGRLIFDYRLRTGIVTRSNALDLMRAVGLDV